MTEPLDPDTLAEGERWRTTPGVTAGVRWGEWVMKNSEALLAVARDHARQREALETVAHIAYIEEGRSYKGRLERAGSCAVDALSAEAGDTDG